MQVGCQLQEQITQTVSMSCMILPPTHNNELCTVRECVGSSLARQLEVLLHHGELATPLTTTLHVRASNTMNGHTKQFKNTGSQSLLMLKCLAEILIIEV